MSTNKTGSNLVPPEIIPEILAEYSALRADMMQRMGVRNQMVSLALVVAGTLFTLGLQKDASATIMFIYPLLGCFITGIWAHNVVFTRRIAFYIRDNIEPKLKGIRWENTAEKERFSLYSISGIISTSGVFLTTQVFAMILGLLKSAFTTVDIFMIVTDSISLIITLLMIFSTMKRESKW